MTHLHSGCAVVCVWLVEWRAACGLLRDEVTCQKGRSPDVMWHQLPLCHFVFPGGGFRGSAKRCLPPLPNKMPTLMLDCAHTHRHAGKWGAYSEVFQKLCQDMSEKTAFSNVQPFSCPVSVFGFSRSLQMFRSIVYVNHSHIVYVRGPPLPSSCLPLTLSLLPSQPHSLCCWWPEQLYNWRSDGSFPANFSF